MWNKKMNWDIFRTILNGKTSCYTSIKNSDQLWKIKHNNYANQYKKQCSNSTWNSNIINSCSWYRLSIRRQIVEKRKIRKVCQLTRAPGVKLKRAFKHMKKIYVHHQFRTIYNNQTVAKDNCLWKATRRTKKPQPCIWIFGIILSTCTPTIRMLILYVHWLYCISREVVV